MRRHTLLLASLLLFPIAAHADDYQKTYSVIYDTKGQRLGTIQGDGVTGREVVYDTRGRRITTIDPQPDYNRSSDQRSKCDDCNNQEDDDQ